MSHSSSFPAQVAAEVDLSLGAPTFMWDGLCRAYKSPYTYYLQSIGKFYYIKLLKLIEINTLKSPFNTTPGMLLEDEPADELEDEVDGPSAPSLLVHERRALSMGELGALSPSPFITFIRGPAATLYLAITSSSGMQASCTKSSIVSSSSEPDSPGNEEWIYI